MSIINTNSNKLFHGLPEQYLVINTSINYCNLTYRLLKFCTMSFVIIIPREDRFNKSPFFFNLLDFPNLAAYLLALGIINSIAPPLCCCEKICFSLRNISCSLMTLFLFVQVFLRNPLQQYYLPPVSNCTDANETMASVNDSFQSVTLLANPTDDYDEFQRDNLTCPTVPMKKYGYPNTALLSVILTSGTFLLAYSLKKFRNGQFLGRSVSSVL